MLATAYASDRARERGLPLASALALVIVGCLLLSALPATGGDTVGPAYFATFLITMGAYTPSCLFHAWHQCNDPSEDGRAFRVGSLTFLANTGGFVSANVSGTFKLVLRETIGGGGVALVEYGPCSLCLYLEGVHLLT